MDRRGLHIAILSFDRPGYLEAVLKSLAVQLSNDDTCFLFQDGGWNRHNAQQKGKESNIAECVRIFSGMLPSGKIFASSENLGIAGNYNRAEEYFFNALRVSSALFLEDDLVLSPDYLNIISELLDYASECPDIGYVSAYGDFWASADEQQQREGELQLMHENWGSALTRQSWLRQKPIREVYWSIVKDCAYGQRNHERIRRFYQDLGFEMRITSQDGARWVACAHESLVRITTRTCHARYIGEIGEHFRAENYRKHRFEDAVFYPKKPSLRNPSTDQIASWQREQLMAMRDGYSHSYIIAGQPNLTSLSADDLLVEGLASSRAGKFGRAREAFEAGIARYPNHNDKFGQPAFRKELLRLICNRRRWGEVAQLIAEWTDLAESSWPRVIIARAHAEAREMVEADAWWKRVQERDPHSIEASAWFKARSSSH